MLSRLTANHSPTSSALRAAGTIVLGAAVVMSRDGGLPLRGGQDREFGNTQIMAASTSSMQNKDVIKY